MPAVSPRINITVPRKIAAELHSKSVKNGVSVSRTALDLLIDAMERDEDLYFSGLADRRETQNKRWLSHAEAWQ